MKPHTLDKRRSIFPPAFRAAARLIDYARYRRPPWMAEVRSAEPSVNEASYTGQTQEQFSGQQDEWRGLRPRAAYA